MIVAVIATAATALAVRYGSHNASVPTIKVMEPLKQEYYMPDDPAAALATAAELNEITQLDLAPTAPSRSRSPPSIAPRRHWLAA